MLHDYYDGFGLVVGKREDIEEIIKLVIKEDEQSKKIARLPEGKYVALEIDEWWNVGAEDLMEKYPACELFIYYGEDKYGSRYYLTSDAGQTTVLDDFLYMHSSGGVDYDILGSWLQRIFEGKSSESSIVVKLNNGQALRYEPSEKSLKMLDSLVSQPLTLGLISDICNPYTMPQKRREFIDSMRASIPTIETVTSIVYSSTVTSSFDESDIAKIGKSDIAEKLSDITVLRFLRAALVEKTEKVFDFAANTLTTTSVTTISAMEDPSAGKYAHIEIEYKKPTEKVKEIVGIAAADYVDLQYKAAGKTGCTCTKCLSDFEVIQVPDEIDGLKVTGIGDGCFEKLANVKKIILPCSVKSIGKGAFAGCKKLVAVVYADNPGSKDDFKICEKGKLVALFTTKTSFVIPDDVSEIGKNAFSNCNKLKELVLRSGMKRLLNDSLAECKSLKTINLSGNLDEINVVAFEKGGIKEVILPNGASVAIHDKFMFGCFAYTPEGMTFSYQQVGEKLSLAGSESVRYKIAMDLIDNHLNELSDSVLSSVLGFAMKHAIGGGDVETLSKLFELETPAKIDFTDMVKQANRCGNSEIVAMVLAKSGQGGDSKKTVIRHETPAEALTGWNKLYIKVRFENNKAYSYFSKFKVKEGDKVFVPGKMAGMPGEVIEILKDSPSGRAAMYTLEVTEAFNVVLEEVDDNLDL